MAETPRETPSSSSSSFLSEEETKKVEDAISVLSELKKKGCKLDNVPSVGDAAPSRPSSSMLGRWARFDSAYKDAIASIRGLGTSSRQQHDSFKRKGGVLKCSTLPKKPKPSSWTHKFVCLSGADDEKVPTTQLARETLSLAGLGEKKVQVPDVDCTTEIFHETLMTVFPKLRNCGGFELLRCIPSTRILEVIPSPICHSARLLRSRIGTARVYIRPIQTDLDVEEVEMGDVKEVMEVCLKCKNEFPLDQLRSHISVCKGNEEVVISDDELDMDIDTSFLSPLYSPQSPTYSPLPDFCDSLFNKDSDEKGDTNAVELGRSKPHITYTKFDTLSEIVHHLSASTNADDIFSVSVRRSDVLGSALCGIDRKAFTPNKHLQINFLGEDGQDGGGPRREFFRLLADDIRCSMCIGRNGYYVLRHDTTGLQIGQLMVMALAQDGGGFPFFANSIYEYICGKDVKDIDVDIESVPDADAYFLLTEMQKIDDQALLQQIVLQHSDVVINSGFSKPLASVKLSDKTEISRAVGLQYTLLQCLAEVDQLKKGLSSLGLLDILQSNPDILAPFFSRVLNDQRLTADKVQNLFQNISFSDVGSNDRIQEEESYMFFVRLLNECEEPDDDPNHLTLEEILIFFTGSDKIPPLGFIPSPSIAFNNDNDYPTSSTCALSLILPTKYCDYSTFKEKVTFGFQNHGGFGLP